MNRKHLRKVAYRLRIDTKNKDNRFMANEHYFDSKDNEIAMVYRPGTREAHVHEFDPPRNWPKAYKEMYTTTILRTKEDEQ